MNVRIAMSLAVIAGLGLASCDKLGGGSRPTGQVVAKVGKDEITVLDLQTELGGFKAPDARTRKAAEQQALNAIIQRKIIAEQARKEKIQKTPEFARLEKRTNELLLAKSWQDKLVRAVPAPSLDEAQTFIAQHPDIYSARKRILVEGMRFASNDRTLGAALQPLKTLEEVQALLVARKIPFQPGTSEIDALAVDPRFIDQLLKLPSGEVFVVPQGNTAWAARIKEIKVDPVPTNIAIQHATQYLRMQRTQQAVGRQASAILAAAKDEVKYNKAYEPPKPPAPAKAGKTPATAPAGKPN